jgi:hypothetical protein
VVYNRRNKLCGFCGAELPAELLFTAEEIAAMKKEEAKAKALVRLEQAKRDIEEAARRASPE